MGKATIEEIVADIVAAAPHSQTPQELRERMDRLSRERPKSIEDLRMAVLGFSAHWVGMAEAEGFDREAAIRIVALEMEAAAAAFIRKLYKEIGGNFSPARFAIVAYIMAEHSEWVVKAAQIDEAEAELIECCSEGPDHA